MNAVINTNASGIWAGRAGETVEVVGPGDTTRTTEVRHVAYRGTVCVPSRWLDTVNDYRPRALLRAGMMEVRR